MRILTGVQMNKLVKLQGALGLAIGCSPRSCLEADVCSPVNTDSRSHRGGLLAAKLTRRPFFDVFKSSFELRGDCKESTAEALAIGEIGRAKLLRTRTFDLRFHDAIG